MESYDIKHISKGEDSQYAIAVDARGRYGILSGFETVNIDSGDIEFVVCGVICPFEYDVILYGGEQYYNRMADASKVKSFELYLLRVFSEGDRKEGLFSTLYGSIILKPISTKQYCILSRATTEGLIGCLKFGHPNTLVFLNFNGEEVIKLDKRWRDIKRGFQGGDAVITSGQFEAKLDVLGRVSDLLRTKRVDLEDSDHYDNERMYRSAFEDDPGAEWNID